MVDNGTHDGDSPHIILGSEIIREARSDETAAVPCSNYSEVVQSGSDSEDSSLPHSRASSFQGPARITSACGLCAHFYHCAGRALGAFFRSKGAAVQDAQDLSQESLTRYWKRRGRIKKGKEWQFLIKIAVYVFHEHRRYLARQKRAVPEEEARYVAAPQRLNPDNKAALAEMLSLLNEQKDALEPHEQEIVRLVDIENHTHSETAAMLQVSREAVTKSHRLILEKLGQRLKDT